MGATVDLKSTAEHRFELDCRGMVCPMPVFKTNLAMKKLAPGETLTITATDKAAVKDLPAWAAHGGAEVLEVTEDGGVIRVTLRKK